MLEICRSRVEGLGREIALEWAQAALQARGCRDTSSPDASAKKRVKWVFGAYDWPVARRVQMQPRCGPTSTLIRNLDVQSRNRLVALASRNTS